MKHYEIMFIVKPTLTEEESQAKLDMVTDIIKANGEVVAPLDMGVRQMAYEIEKQKRGHYYLVYYKAKGSVNKELERVFGITEDIIRFMVVKYESKREIANWEKMVVKYSPKSETKVEPKAEAAVEAKTEESETKAEA
jgi:small subunit ribosomal protein S6